VEFLTEVLLAGIMPFMPRLGVRRSEFAGGGGGGAAAHDPAYELEDGSGALLMEDDSFILQE
jgi:hypothetical protein